MENLVRAISQFDKVQKLSEKLEQEKVFLSYIVQQLDDSDMQNYVNITNRHINGTPYDIRNVK